MPTLTRTPRRTERVKATQPVSVAWDDLQGQHKFAFVHSIDFSKQGIAIHLSEALQVGSYVSLRSTQLKLACTAQVKNCIRLNHLFRVGLAFTGQSESTWN